MRPSAPGSERVVLPSRAVSSAVAASSRDAGATAARVRTWGRAGDGAEDFTRRGSTDGARGS